MCKYTKAVEHYCEGLKDVNPGSVACCPICLDEFGIEVEDGFIVKDNVPYFDQDAAQDIMYQEETSFSRQQCDTCGSQLGGDRSNGHGFDNNDEVVHLSMCVDCVMFFANGDEPETWE